MPVVSVSLSDVGYEGYKGLPKGSRSRMIDGMLRNYALDHHHTIVNNQRRSVREVMEVDALKDQRIESYIQEVSRLKEELKEMKQ